MAIRKLHDLLGFCAKGQIKTGGLCSGTIFRTVEFIEIEQDERSGARVSQTVHIEHTVPVNVLAREVEAQIVEPARSSDEVLAWLLKHSVTTALKKGQETDYLTHVTRSTEALTDGSPDLNLPFRRYSKLFAAGKGVWDVWNLVEVDPDTLTFDDHMTTMLSIMNEAGADPVFIDRMRAAL